MRLEQQQLSFDRQITRAVNQFNLQERRVEIAHRTMLTAQHRYEVARQLYMTGRSTVLDLNSAITSKDSAYRGYVSALSTWWQLCIGLALSRQIMQLHEGTLTCSSHYPFTTFTFQFK